MKILKLPNLSNELEMVPIEMCNNGLFIKYYHEGVSAGFPSPADDFKEHKLSLDEHYIEDIDSTYLIRVVGNSMYPTLMEGDLLIVKADEQLYDNCIGIVSVNNTDFTVKRFSKNTQQLLADNVKHPNISIDESDTIMCLGVVKHLIRDL